MSCPAFSVSYEPFQELASLWHLRIPQDFVCGAFVVDNVLRHHVARPATSRTKPIGWVWRVNDRHLNCRPRRAAGANGSNVPHFRPRNVKNAAAFIKDRFGEAAVRRCRSPWIKAKGRSLLPKRNDV
jgi:hypothetical protein